METQVCQVCKERKAFKKVVSNIEGDFFLVCKKKKCQDKLYGDLIEKGNEAQKDFVRRMTWDSSEFQGRSYDRIKRDEKVVMYTFLILTTCLFLFTLYSVLVNVFKISFF